MAFVLPFLFFLVTAVSSVFMITKTGSKDSTPPHLTVLN
ncbi:hypothetical protein MHSWG343_00850 [Candidatus Mycoplasma haematohominis]|uniref:Uncharacterized protein n=1 Tax=Candidatus Mycoplasma haematohominis TaxID=1494318 RepID=A0A478FPX3_9MOLU|nr:hypothetical protein MHSWG343_00850 [Candidatus Mycoplasma haemohominis]